jgi:hypothetical protein
MSADLLALGHQILESQYPAQITIHGQTVAALVSGLRKGRSDAQGGGSFDEVSGQISVRKALLNTPPKAGEIFTYEGEEYFIGDVEHSAACYEFAAQATNREPEED